MDFDYSSLEKIAIQLKRIADALEGKKVEKKSVKDEPIETFKDWVTGIYKKDSDSGKAILLSHPEEDYYAWIPKRVIDVVNFSAQEGEEVKIKLKKYIYGNTEFIGEWKVNAKK